MNAILKQFVDGMAACGYEPKDAVSRAHSIAVRALREKAVVHSMELKKNLEAMSREELAGLIAEIERMEGGEL